MVDRLGEQDLQRRIAIVERHIRSSWDFLKAEDPEVAHLIVNEWLRHSMTIGLIASENYPSLAVHSAVGSIFMAKYAEGYPRRRFYEGQDNIDSGETLCIDRVRGLPWGGPIDSANVQPYSGSNANLAAYLAVAEPGEIVSGLSLDSGGHLTHGADASRVSKIFKVVQFGTNEDELLNYDKLQRLAEQHLPKAIMLGTTAYPRFLDWKRAGEIADSVNAYLIADVAHVAGLIIGGQYPSPAPYADLITFTWQKTFRGPRGGAILVTKKGSEKYERLKKDPDDKNDTLVRAVNSAVFPGVQGGPHPHAILGAAVAAGEAATDGFKVYAENVVSNAHILEAALKVQGFDLVTGGTDSHLLLVNLRKHGVTGRTVAEALKEAGLVANRNSIKGDERAFYPTGLRLGTPPATSRGMDQVAMAKIAGWIGAIVEELSVIHQHLGFSSVDEENAKKRRDLIGRVKSIPRIRAAVLEICDQFPIRPSYGQT